MRHRGAATQLLAVALALAACDQKAVESWLSPKGGVAAGPSLYTEQGFSRALAEMGKRLPPPVHALSLLVYPDHLVLQVQDPAAKTRVLQYVYRDGAMSEPVAVKLLGTGKLDENVFPLESVKVDAIPTLVREARARADIPEGAVARVLLRRNLPETTDVQFRVFVTSQRSDATIEADHTGKIVAGGS